MVYFGATCILTLSSSSSGICVHSFSICDCESSHRQSHRSTNLRRLQANTTANPAYPCPSGYSLTYAATNVTVPYNTSRVAAAFGNWATSPFYPNITNATGDSDINASHNIHVAGLEIHERLVDRVFNVSRLSSTYDSHVNFLLCRPRLAITSTFGTVRTVPSRYRTRLSIATRASSNGTMLGSICAAAGRIQRLLQRSPTRVLFRKPLDCGF